VRERAIPRSLVSELRFTFAGVSTLPFLFTRISRLGYSDSLFDRKLFAGTRPTLPSVPAILSLSLSLSLFLFTSRPIRQRELPLAHCRGSLASLTEGNAPPRRLPAGQQHEQWQSSLAHGQQLLSNTTHDGQPHDCPRLPLVCVCPSARVGATRRDAARPRAQAASASASACVERNGDDAVSRRCCERAVVS